MSLVAAKQAIDAGDGMLAGKILTEHLYAEPDDPKALYLFGWALLESKLPAIAQIVSEKLLRLDRKWSSLYLYGACSLHMQRHDKAAEYLQRAFERRPTYAIAYLLASTYIEVGRLADAQKWAEKALGIKDDWRAKVVLAHIHLHRRQWGAGWDLYEHGLGNMEWRTRHEYGIPDWQGDRKTVLLYAEQGLGDQIAWSSAIPDVPLARQLNCAPKLEGLMRRTFPHLEVHGQQFTEPVTFDVRSEAQASLSQAMRYVRREWVPSGRYLVPDRARVIQWGALLRSLGDGLKVGIAWTGGSTRSAGSRSRNLTLQQLRPLLSLPVHWVSLEYRDPSVEIREFLHDTGITVNHWKWATETNDLDDFVALVEALDLVVCVPTTAYHVAGGLGKPCRVIVHDTPHFHEGVEGTCPYWQSVVFVRRSEMGTESAIDNVRDVVERMMKPALAEAV